MIRQSKDKDHDADHGCSSNRSEMVGPEPLWKRSGSNPSLVSAQSSKPLAKEAQNSLFMDPNAIKAKVRETLAKPIYNVQDQYWDQGICQWIARSSIFEKVTLFIIAFNAVWIAIDTDHNDAEVLTEAPFIFQFAEHFFCAFFFGEFVVRLGAFRRKRDGLRDAWFLFDSALVSMMILETWILTIVLAILASVSHEEDSGSSGGTGLQNASILRMARVLRLSRMARMARLLRAVPELMILIKGLAAAMRSVFFALCLLLGIIFVFAIAFTQLTIDFDFHRVYFSHVLLSMYTLLFRGALLDNVSFIINEIGERSLPLAGLFVCFVFISALTVMNMLIGVLVEVVSSVARLENEEAMLSFVRSKMEPLVMELDTDGNSELSRYEFMKLVENPTACQTLSDVGVDPVGLVDYADFIFSDVVTGEERPDLSYTDFMEVVLELRGSNSATVKDIVDLRKFITSVFDHFEVKLDAMISRRIRSSLSSVSSVRSSAAVDETKSRLHRSVSFSATVASSSTEKSPSSPASSAHELKSNPSSSVNERKTSISGSVSEIDTEASPTSPPPELRHNENRHSDRSALGTRIRGLVEDLEISLKGHVQHLESIMEAAQELPKAVTGTLTSGASRGLQSRRLDLSFDLKRLQLGEHVDACAQLISVLQDRLSNLGQSLHRPPACMSLTNGLPPAPTIMSSLPEFKDVNGLLSASTPDSSLPQPKDILM